MVKTMVRWAVTLQSMEVNGGADTNLMCPERRCDSVERTHWKFSARTCDPMVSHARTISSSRTAPSGKDTFWNSSLIAIP